MKQFKPPQRETGEPARTRTARKGSSGEFRCTGGGGREAEEEGGEVEEEGEEENWRPKGQGGKRKRVKTREETPITSCKRTQLVKSSGIACMDARAAGPFQICCAELLTLEPLGFFRSATQGFAPLATRRGGVAIND